MLVKQESGERGKKEKTKTSTWMGCLLNEEWEAIFVMGTPPALSLKPSASPQTLCFCLVTPLGEGYRHFHFFLLSICVFFLLLHICLYQLLYM